MQAGRCTFRVQTTASKVNELDADFLVLLGQHDVLWLDVPVTPVLVQVFHDLESIRTFLAFITGKLDDQ